MCAGCRQDHHGRTVLQLAGQFDTGWLPNAQMREADKNRRGKKQRGGFADDQEDAGDGIAKSFKKRRY